MWEDTNAEHHIGAEVQIYIEIKHAAFEAPHPSFITRSSLTVARRYALNLQRDYLRLNR